MKNNVSQYIFLSKIIKYIVGITFLIAYVLLDLEYLTYMYRLTAPKDKALECVNEIIPMDNIGSSRSDKILKSLLYISLF